MSASELPRHHANPPLNSVLRRIRHRRPRSLPTTQSGLPDHRADGEAQDRTAHDVTGVVHSVVDPAVANDGGHAVERERKHQGDRLSRPWRKRTRTRCDLTGTTLNRHARMASRWRVAIGRAAFGEAGSLRPGSPWRRRSPTANQSSEGCPSAWPPARQGEGGGSPRATVRSSRQRPRAGPTARPTSASASWQRRHRPRGREHRPPSAFVAELHRRERTIPPLSARSVPPSRSAGPRTGHYPARPATCHSEQAHQRGHPHRSPAKRRGGTRLPIGDTNPQRTRPDREGKRRLQRPRLAVDGGDQWTWPPNLEMVGGPLAPAFEPLGMTGYLQGHETVHVGRAPDRERRHPESTRVQAGAASRTRSRCTRCRGCWRPRRAARRRSVPPDRQR